VYATAIAELASAAFTVVYATAIAELASAAFTAVTAAAALLTVRNGRSENRIARDALEAQTQPLVTDLPRGLIREEMDWHDASGQMSRRMVDRAEISVGPAVLSRSPVRACRSETSAAAARASSTSRLSYLTARPPSAR
jgi:hypothetical protein